MQQATLPQLLSYALLSKHTLSSKLKVECTSMLQTGKQHGHSPFPVGVMIGVLGLPHDHVLVHVYHCHYPTHPIC